MNLIATIIMIIIAPIHSKISTSVVVVVDNDIDMTRLAITRITSS